MKNKLFHLLTMLVFIANTLQPTTSIVASATVLPPSKNENSQSKIPSNSSIIPLENISSNVADTNSRPYLNQPEPRMGPRHNLDLLRNGNGTQIIRGSEALASVRTALSAPQFIENVGQFDEQVLYYARVGNKIIQVSQREFWITSVDEVVAEADAIKAQTDPYYEPSKVEKGKHLRVTFPNAKANLKVEGINRLQTTVSYLIGNDAGKWNVKVPVYDGIRFVDIYPGVDFEITGVDLSADWHYVVKDKNAFSAFINKVDRGTIGLKVEGGTKIETFENTLIVETETGKVLLPKPVFRDEHSQPGKAYFRSAETIQQDTLSLVPDLSSTEQTSALAIPLSMSALEGTSSSSSSAISYSTYFGGTDGEQSFSIAVDLQSNIYITGSVSSTDFPTSAGAYKKTLTGGSDSFITKINATGTAIVYSTYIGGSSNTDESRGIAVDASGSAYITGRTFSTDFPTTSGSIKSTKNTTDDDGYVAKLSPDGTQLVYSTYIGGAGGEQGFDIAINQAGEAYVTGQTYSTDFPTTANTFQSVYAGGAWDGYVARLNTTGTAFIFSSYIGGNYSDCENGGVEKECSIRIDASGDVYVFGVTESTNFPATKDGDMSFNGASDAFAVKLSPDGKSLLYGTYLGGSDRDCVRSCSGDVDSSGAIYISGSTASNDFPQTLGTRQGDLDIFVTKIYPDARLMAYSMVFGGSNADYGDAITVLPFGEVYITGSTVSSDFPIAPNAFQSTLLGSEDAFLVKLNPDATSYFSTYFGGTGQDFAKDLAIDISGGAYISGSTFSSDYPVTPGVVKMVSSGNDIFLTKFSSQMQTTVKNEVTNSNPWTKENRTDCRECPKGMANKTQGTGGDPINTRTGGFDYTVTDLSFPTSAGEMLFQRSYSSSVTTMYTVPLGPGWTHNQDTRLIFSSEPGGDPDGILFKAHSLNVYRYLRNDDGTYSPDSGVLGSLVYNPGAYVLTDPNQSVYTFGENGKLTQWRNSAGHFWTYTYGVDGNLSRVSDDTNLHYLDFHYNASGYLTSVSDFSGREVVFGYNAANDLNAVTDAAHQGWTYVYDSEHRLQKVIDPNGHNVVHTEYDAQGRAFRQYDGKNQLVLEIVYNADGTTQLTDGEQNAQTHNYNSRNILYKAELSTGGSAEYQEYDANFRPSTSVDPNENRTDMLWSPDGVNLNVVVAPAGDRTDLFYDGVNNLTSVTDPNGYLTSYTYENTLLTTATDALDNETHYTYTTAADAPQPFGLLKTVEDPQGRVTTYTYNSFGEVVTITDAANQVTSYDYDALGRQKSVHYPSGRKDWSCYDLLDRIVRQVLNASGDGLSPQTDPCDGVNYQPSTDPGYDQVSQTVYDPGGNIIATIAPDGVITRTYYDENNRLVSIVQNLYGQSIETATPPIFNLAFPDRNVRTDTVYNQNGAVIATIDPLGTITRTYYDQENRPQYVVWNLIGQDITVNTPPTYNPNYPDRNLITRTVYDRAGNSIATIDPAGVITRTYYDADNRPVTTVVNLTNWSIEDPTPPTYLASTPDANVRNDMVYDANGNLIANIDPNSVITRTYYDALNRVQTVVQNLVGQAISVQTPPTYDPATPDRNLITDNVYDAAGNLIAVIDPSGIITRTYYDVLNRPIIVVRNLRGQPIDQATPPSYNLAYPDQNVRTETRYDDKGRSIATIDPNGIITRTYYDQYERVQFNVSNLTGQTIETAAPPVYDPQHPDQNVRTEYRYDHLGRQIATIDNDGKITRSYYDALGRVSFVVQNLSGQTIENPVPPTYDSNYPDQNTRTETVYDGAGRTYKTIDAVGKQTYACYDGAGRVVKTIVNPTVSNPCVDYTPSTATDTDIISTTIYDAAGNQLATRDPNGKEITFQYDHLNRVLTETDPLQHVTQYTYDAIGNQLTRKDAANVVTFYEYDPLNRLKAVVENYRPGLQADQETNVRTEYTYDANGNRKTIKDGLSHTTTFTYDALSRLSSESDALSHTTVYQYDAAGNRVQMLDANGATTIYHYDGLGRLVNIDYPDPDSDVSFSYDAAGNRKTLSDGTGTTRWDYDALNRPTAITDPSNAVVRYGYNAAGQRTSLQYPDTKTVSYVYDDAGRLEVVTGWDTLRTQYTYDRGGQPHTVTFPNGVVSTYTFDDASRLESLSHEKDAQVLSSFTYGYDAVGNRTSATEVLEPPAGQSSDPVFQDGFESGDLSAWSGSQTDGGDLSVTAAAASGGSYGLQAVLDDNNDLYAVDWTPVAEKQYRARFYFDPNAINMGASDSFQIIQLYDQNNTLLGVLELRSVMGDYQLRVGAINDSTGWTYSSWIASTNRLHAVELDWRAATVAGANNGGMTLWVDGKQRTSFSALDNDTRQVDYIKFGAMGVDTSTRGTLYYDAFESRRQSYIDLDPSIPIDLTIPDLVFSDGFESGDLSNWSAATTGGGDLSVTSQAALSGTQGLQVVINDNTSIYVTDWNPIDETHFRARFHFDPNSISMANGDAFHLFEFYDLNNILIGYIDFRYSAGDYQILGSVTKDSGSVVTPWVTITDGPNAIEFDWQSASIVGANDGTYTLWVNDVQQATLTGIDNDTRKVDYARLGAAAGIDTSTRGTIYLDSFVTYRESYIGADPQALPPVPFPTKTDALFADPFETGSLSAWSVATTDGGDLSEATQAAISGATGLQAVINNNTAIYVTDWRPFEENHYRTRFHFDPNAIAMAHGDAFQIFDIYSRDGTAVAYLNFGYNAGDYQVQGYVAKDSGSVTTPWVTLTDSPHALEIEWQAATTAGANDGGFTLWLDGIQAATLTAIDNDTRRGDYVNLGAVAGIDTTTRGTVYFDSFESRRDTYIGPDANALPPSPFPTKTDALFADSFESGDFYAWSLSTTDSGHLSVSDAAALSGSKGLQAVVSDNNPLYVTDYLPFEETHYRARFHLDPNSLVMAHNDQFRLLELYDRANVSVGFVDLRYSAGDYQVQASITKDSGSSTTAWVTLSDGPHAVELDWQAATAAGANNGSLTLWVDGVAQPTLSALDNDTRKIDYVRFGGVSGIDTTTRGAFYLDAFESRRSTYIGPDASALPPVPFPTKTDALFDDTFDGGNLAAWSAAVTDNGNLSVTSQAALTSTGGSGLQALINDNNAIYVTDYLPFEETHFRARFHFDPNSISMANGDTFYLFEAFTRDISNPAASVRLRYSVGEYQAQASILNDANTLLYTPWVTLTDGPHAFEIEWKAASAAGANNGFLTLWIDGAQAGTQSAVDNDTRRVDYATLGPVGIPTGSRGTLYFDSFESRRETAIGPDPNGLPPVSVSKPDALFSDGFESGNLANWSQTAIDGGHLSVTSAAALSGAYGLQAQISDNTSLYVTDWKPFDETHYRARFTFDPNSIIMASGNAHYLFYAYDRNNVLQARIEFRYYSSAYQVRAEAVSDTGAWSSTAWATISDASHSLEMEWQAASTVGANNGKLNFWVDGNPQGSFTTIDNDTRRIDFVQLGGVAGIDTGTRGTEYFDAFESRRESYIGVARLPGGPVIAGPVGGRKGLANIRPSRPVEPEALSPSGEAQPGVTAVPEPVLISRTPFSPLPAALFAPTPSAPAQAARTQTISYTYDPLYRLRTATYTDGTSFVYTYDAVGNRLSQTRTGGLVDSYSYDPANRLTSVSGVSYTWDNTGNLLSDGSTAYTYDHANRLVGVSQPAGTTSYGYNGLGDRVRETVNGVTTSFTLDLASGLTQVLADGSNTYLYGNTRIAQYNAGGPAYFLGDALGSVRQLADANGAVTLSRSYQPYGAVLSSLGSAYSNYGYTGEWASSSTNLVYLRARFFQSSIGRFLTRDTWQGEYNQPLSLNKWNYVNSNPINNTDHTGHKIDKCGLLSGEARKVCEDSLGCQEVPKLQSNGSYDYFAEQYGVKFSGEEWSNNELEAAITALADVGVKLATLIGGSGVRAFREAYFTSERILYLNKGNAAPLFTYQGMDITSGMVTAGASELISDRTKVWLIKMEDGFTSVLRLKLNFVHEFGHLLNPARYGAPYFWMHKGIEGNPLLARESTSDYNGFASQGFPWQMAVTNVSDRSEIFADQYMGWVYGKWQMEKGALTKRGKARSDFMEKYMQIMFGYPVGAN